MYSIPRWFRLTCFSSPCKIRLVGLVGLGILKFEESNEV